jgi:O-antigen ligase
MQAGGTGVPAPGGARPVVDLFARLAHGLVLAVVLLAPLPLGANRPLFWSAAGIALGLAVLLAGVSLVAGGARVPRGLRYPAIVYLLVLAWIAVQAAPGLPGILHHPAWEDAAATLGRPLDGTIGASQAGAVDTLIRWGGFGAVFLVMTLTTSSPAAGRRTIAILVAGGTILVVVSIGLQLSGASGRFVPRWAYADLLAGPFVNPNSFATWIGVLLVCALAAMLRFPAEETMETAAPRRIAAVAAERAAFGTAFVLLTLALALTGSRAGVAVTAFAVLVVLAIHVYRRGERSRFAGPAAMVIGVVAVLAIGAALQDLLSGTGGLRTDLDNRVRIWRATLAAIADRPILGHGAGAFSQVIPAYFDAVPHLRTVRQAHGTWLELAAGLGIPMALAWLSALAVIAGRLGSAALNRRRYGVPLAAVSAMLLVGLHATVDFSIQVPAVAYLLAAVAGVAYAMAREGDGGFDPAHEARPQR